MEKPLADIPDRLAHTPVNFGPAVTVRMPVPAGMGAPDRPPTIALTAEGPRRADLIAWASAHRTDLARLRLLAPPGIGVMLAERVGLRTEPLRAGTLGPAATAGLAAAGEIDAMIAFSDPIELRPGDTTTRALTRLAVFWDIPIAGNRATADLLLTTVLTAYPRPLGEPPAARPPGAEADPSAAVGRRTAADDEPARGAIRLWTVRATVDDVPGRLAVLAASLARRAINILSVQVHLTPQGPVDELLVAASPVLSSVDLMAAVTDGGGRAPRVMPADAHALVDAPTRALALAARLLRTPNDLPAILVGLLPGSQLSWRAEPPTGGVEDPLTIWLTDPTGGGFLLTRTAVPYTPAESARAHAMLELAALALERPARNQETATRVVLPDGAEVVLRRALPADLEAVIALHQRCSPSNRRRRYLAGTNTPSALVLDRLLSATAGYSLVVEDVTGEIIALGNLMWQAPGADLALLVADDWQRRRLGTVLARRLAAEAIRTGVNTLFTNVHPGHTAMINIMAGLGRRLHREYEGGQLTLIATLAPSGAPAPLPPSDPAVAEQEVSEPVGVRLGPADVHLPVPPEAERDE